MDYNIQKDIYNIEISEIPFDAQKRIRAEVILRSKENYSSFSDYDIQEDDRTLSNAVIQTENPQLENGRIHSDGNIQSEIQSENGQLKDCRTFFPKCNNYFFNS